MAVVVDLTSDTHQRWPSGEAFAVSASGALLILDTSGVPCGVYAAGEWAKAHIHPADPELAAVEPLKPGEECR